MGVPYTQFWHTPPFVDPLTHLHRVVTAADWWVHGDVEGLVSTGATPLIQSSSHAVGRLPGASIKDRVTAWHAMQRVVQQFPNLLQQVPRAAICVATRCVFARVISHRLSWRTALVLAFLHRPVLCATLCR